MQLEKVGKNFKIIKKIGEGAFGQIYQAINTKTNLEVAVKTEGVSS
jgi:serine/threonine protein kinase